jgi:hypothetical protein
MGYYLTVPDGSRNPRRTKQYPSSIQPHAEKDAAASIFFLLYIGKYIIVPKLSLIEPYKRSAKL